MTKQQVQSLRKEINAAHAAGNMKKANALQAKLHAHFTAEADAFVRSPEGQKHAEYLMGRP